MNEYQLHLSVVEYVQYQYPDLMWYSDLNGVRLPIGLAVKVKRLQHPQNKWLDIFFPEPRGDYNGLFIELKCETYGARGYLLKDGCLSTREHIQAQQKAIDYLLARNFAAFFAGGFDEAKTIIDDYFNFRG